MRVCSQWFNIRLLACSGIFKFETEMNDSFKKPSNRRVFILQSVAAAGVAALGTSAQAQAMVADTDPQAAALGYKSDATKADKAKFPKYAAGQVCGNCALFQGKAGDAAGACPLFAGKQVSATGWCSAYAKKG